MAGTTRGAPTDATLPTAPGVAGPAPAGAGMEARAMTGLPASRLPVLAPRSLPADCRVQAGRLLGSNPRRGAEETSLRTSPVAFEAAPPSEMIELDRLDGALLRRRWRSIMGRHPPKTLSPALMVRILTWREQVLEVGDVSPRSRAILAAALRGKDARAETESEERPTARRSPRFKPICAGTVLIREHAGVLHRVTVAADGFDWNGRTFGSLSAVARAITGVSWSGRRFFGLDRGLREAAERSRPGKPNGTSRAGGSP